MSCDPRSYEDSKAVSRANLAFYRAFERLDLDAMSRVWLRAPFVKCIHPGGETLTGYEAVMASWKTIFDNTESIRFSVHDIDVRVVGDLAWVSLTEAVDTGFSAHERGTTVAATNLYERREDSWKLVLHHASPMLRRVGTDVPPDALPGIL
jgi:ketosteroid isomerase-like protein